ncbi:hypothetical protein KS4_23330 [Poriferisphaera corsica]|uniref:Uncharacterized protein n=1 Tax=Poriferisphaera corsica TaxID=2528020 RepID=A0A517YVM9_9BACT|nr:hypothetical protein [Poriferisphaera corsica]QDU34266.1 hypothetical protein KS4_23330 [Poriferisphaera corsica]
MATDNPYDNDFKIDFSVTTTATSVFETSGDGDHAFSHFQIDATDSAEDIQFRFKIKQHWTSWGRVRLGTISPTIGRVGNQIKDVELQTASGTGTCDFAVLYRQ